MDATVPTTLIARKPTFVELFTPKLATVLREGYGPKDLRADAFAGLTVAIVALPLSMAIAIASGTTPDRGLYTAIVGGFVVSLFGGSRFQIGGPAGAFIVLVAATIERHGIDGLVLATMLCGVVLLLVGLLRLGTYIKFIPFPVTVGFTAGIGLIILASQLKDLLGLTLWGPEPSAFAPKLHALAAALPTANPSAVGVAALTVGIIVGLRRFRPHWPNLLIAVVCGSLAAWAVGLPVETIGSRFGAMPRTLPVPMLPDLSPARVAAVLPDALAFALLGGIESLLSAVVADGMTGRRHRSNCELVAQGAANIACGLFGGICVTGTIARTATNVRAGARGPISGMLHAVFLALFMLIAAPLAGFIPLAALAAVLAVVAWNMVERHAIATVIRSSWGDTVVLAATLLLTIFRDLIEGIVVGFAIGALLFLNRMAQAISIETHVPAAPEDRADDDWEGGRTAYDPAAAGDPDVVVYRIRGAFFFAAASSVGALLESIAERPKAVILDFSAVPLLDSTAANTLEAFARKAASGDTRVILTGTTPAIRRVLFAHGLRPPKVSFKRTVSDALAATAGSRSSGTPKPAEAAGAGS